MSSIASRGHEVIDQAVSYTNRFGPGVVIYWFNCVESLHIPDVVVTHGFPDVCFLTPDEDADSGLPPDFLWAADAESVTY